MYTLFNIQTELVIHKVRTTEKQCKKGKSLNVKCNNSVILPYYPLIFSS